jgi:hypothetical protein
MWLYTNKLPGSFLSALFRDTDYHRHEGFHSLVGTNAEKHLRMEDLEVDDDEWQISAWFFRDQAKQTPLASLDFNQHLFAVTGTFRAQERDEGFIVFSRDHFFNMFGPFPSNFSPEDMDELSVCPYHYNAMEKQWTNKITGGHPLIFHFAGNDWLCACSVFAAEGFQGITGKFQNVCLHEFKKWSGPVHDGIQYVANAEDSSIETFVYVEEEGRTVSAERRLDDGLYRRLDDGPYHRQLDNGDDGPYRRNLADDGPYRRNLGDDGPYRRNLGDDGPYRRNLGDDGPYRRSLGDDGPYRRNLGDDGPYRRNLGDDGPYRRNLGDDGPYRRNLGVDGPYRRSLGDDGPYRRNLGDDGPYSRKYRRHTRD